MPHQKPSIPREQGVRSSPARGVGSSRCDGRTQGYRWGGAEVPDPVQVALPVPLERESGVSQHHAALRGYACGLAAATAGRAAGWPGRDACLKGAGAGAWLKRVAGVKPSTNLRETPWLSLFSGNSFSPFCNVKGSKHQFANSGIEMCHACLGLLGDPPRLPSTTRSSLASPCSRPHFSGRCSSQTEAARWQVVRGTRTALAH